jgi:competence protein ComEC
MHVVILVGIAVALIRQLVIRLPWLSQRFEARRIACALGVPVALVFALFAGGAPSAWRAAITASIGWTFVAAGKRPQASAVAAAAAITLGALRPHEAVHPSFLLSIVATTAILSAPQFDQTSIVDWLKSGFTIAFRTTIATAPIVLWCFGTVPIIGLITNVLLLPVASLLLMPLAAMHAVVATLCAPMAAITAFPLSIVANAFITACRVFASLPFSRSLPPPDIAQGITIALAAILLLAVSRTRLRIIVSIVTLLTLIAFEVRLRVAEQPRDQLRITYLDVGQGDSALIDLPDGGLMVVDGGGNPHSGIDPGRAVLVPLLRARRRSRVDVVVVSHPHPDHYGGLFAVSENVAVDELWDTGQGRS